MLIVCENCEASYEVEAKAIGEVGRKVRCAECGHIWKAVLPESDREEDYEQQLDQEVEDFSEALQEQTLEEDNSEKDENTSELDAILASEKVAEENPLDDAIFNTEFHAEEVSRENVNQAAFTRRLSSSLRLKSRLNIRYSPIYLHVAASLVCVAILTGLMLNRNDIAHRFPQTASLFEAVGLEVNSYGLNVENFLVYRLPSPDGLNLVVKADIRNTLNQNVSLPRLKLVTRDILNVPILSNDIALEQQSLGARAAYSFEKQIKSAPVKSDNMVIYFN